jgi:hypothetical protein
MASLDTRLARLEGILNPPPIVEHQHPLTPCESRFGFCGCAADDQDLSKRRLAAVFADVDSYVRQVAARHSFRADAPRRNFEEIRWDIFKFLGLWPTDTRVLSLMLMAAERIVSEQLRQSQFPPLAVEHELVAQVVAVRLAEESHRDYDSLVQIARWFVDDVHRKISRGGMPGPGPWRFPDVADVLLAAGGSGRDPDRPRLVEIAREVLDDLVWYAPDAQAAVEEAQRVLHQGGT